MGIYIKDIEMPTSCSKCAFCGYYGNKTHICDINQQTADYEDMLKNRRGDCPLVPVPPHGRLIDADAFEEYVRKDWDRNDHWIADVVYSRPTIIPAEEGEE